MWPWQSKRSSIPEGGTRTTYHRREVLKLGAIVGTGLPVVLTLRPREARAAGSWHTLNPNQAQAQGSWHNGTPNDRVIDRHMGNIDRRDRHNLNEPSFRVPGSYQWREQRDSEREQRKRLRGEFSRFGNGD
jgi:hypothetical protein